MQVSAFAAETSTIKKIISITTLCAVRRAMKLIPFCFDSKDVLPISACEEKLLQPEYLWVVLLLYKDLRSRYPRRVPRS